ncbi:MAG: tetratricopeptide repeat protein, partial [Victivallales bacterium]|nr:tetratricopeptide repeat protein [Victivallales bacterium]
MMKRIIPRLLALRTLTLLPVFGLLGLPGLLQLHAQENADGKPVVTKEAAADAAGKDGGKQLGELESLFEGVEDTAKKGDAKAVKKDVPEPVPVAPEAATPKKGDGEPRVEKKEPEINHYTQVRRREKEMMADALAIQGNKAFGGGDFLDASKLYLQAKSKLKEVSVSVPRIIRKQENIDVALHSLYMQWGQELVEEARAEIKLENIDTAVEKLLQAREYDPSKSEEIDATILRYNAIRRSLAIREETDPEKVDPGHKQRIYDITVLIEQGKVYLERRQYADARDKFEQVLLLDPYEMSAIRLLRQIYVELEGAASAKRDAMVAETMAEVAWKWCQPVT